MNQYLSQDDIILVEEPSYFLAINIFKEYGLTIETIPMKKDGLDLEVLEEKVRKYSNIQKNIFLYTIPTCHNPTGYTLTDSKRKSLASIATVYNNFYVIADEVYHFLRWDDSEKILPLSDYHPNFISVGSFSKLLAPSLRVGWIYINLTHKNKNDETSVIDDLTNSAVFDSSGGINVLGSMIVHQAIDTGFLDQYIKESLELLKSRCMTIVNKLKDQDMFEYEVPLGGYFLWLKSKYNTAQVLKTAENYKIRYHYGSKFSSHNEMKEYLRLSFSYYDSEDLQVGIDRLVSCYKDYQKVKVAIMGSKGKLGSTIVNLLSQKPYSDKYMVVFEIDRNSFTKTDTPNKLKMADIILDISSADGTMQLINYLNDINFHIPILSGTTGHSDENFKVMNEYGQKSTISNINNFSKGIPVLKNIIKVVNSLPSDWKVKIIETHHVHKKDSPSGTAKVLQSLIEKECTIESIREGENYGNHKIICSNNYETIEFTHQALDRNLFAKGCLDMINNVLSSSGFVTDLNLKTNLKDSSDGVVYSAHGNILKVIENFEGSKELYVLQESKNNNKLDGIIFIENVNDETYTCDWQYYNRDGNEVDFCENGIRCIMKYVYDKYKIEYLNLEYKSDNILDDSLFDVRYNKGDIMIQSPDHIDDEEFTHVMQSMLETECEKLEIEVIDMELHHVGVPHLIIELKEDVLLNRDLLDILGNILSEYYIENIDENGVNINFVNQLMMILTIQLILLPGKEELIG